MMKRVGIGLVSCFVLLVVGCSSSDREEDSTGEVTSPLRPADCSLVLCALPVCAPGEVLTTRPNQCCPTCAPPKGKKPTTSCSPACGSGYNCQECKTIDGTGFFCLPDGAAC
jgi:hypothetical protein